ncbi:MAG: MoxR family ATPase [Pseudomonadota bacterium]
MTKPHAAETAIESLRQDLLGTGYLADQSMLTVLYLATKLHRPVLLEGEAGVGKTALAKALSEARSSPLYRVQCYEGIEQSAVLYEWNYPRQMLEMRRAALDPSSGNTIQLDDLYRREFLIARPLLHALEYEGDEPPVLLIDELDRADAAFEAFLLEFLGESQVTIPEFGTIRARALPQIIITSNRTRELHDALKRRCLYHWLDYPELAREKAILALKVPDLGEKLALQLAQFIAGLRRIELLKAPGIAEVIDWAEALLALSVTELDSKTITQTLGVVLKHQDDIEQLRSMELTAMLEQERVSTHG